MELTIDHVTVAGCDLDALSQAFTDAGLPVTYGGKHSNGATHMAIVGFPDGSYIELISTIESTTYSPWWNLPIHDNGGPCAWAISVNDIDAISQMLQNRGITVDGPAAFEREREDGTIVKWDLSFLGDDDPGASLPFLISDRTPRERRIQSTGDSSPFIGVDTVVLGVSDLPVTVERLMTAFSIGTPKRGTLEHLNADVAVFTDAPIAVAAPRGNGWLTDRLDRFGPCPVAYLLEVDSNDLSAINSTSPDELVGREVSWIPPAVPVGRRYLGVIETSH